MLSILSTSKINEANFITHGGVFHADEVMAAAILDEIWEQNGKDMKLARVFKVPDEVMENPNVVVFDIGGGTYDHHQKGGNGTRLNGVPYASCGLIWRDYYHFLVDDFVYYEVDKRLIQGIDAVDNGVTIESSIPTMSISSVISSFNPTWDSDEKPDDAFLKAVELARTVFRNLCKSVQATEKAQSIVEDAINASANGVMTLDQFVPWQNALFASNSPKASKILYVIFPSVRGGYNIQCVPEELGSFVCKKPLPEAWRGLPADDLVKVTGVADATFCHQAGFIAAAGTLEGVTALAEKALKEVN